MVTVRQQANRYSMDDCDLQLENTFVLDSRIAACRVSEERFCHY
jgi:hypothetical protein